jgi:NodT family efflux transporter outer membrane factor (OMF) lipoprotein
LNRLVADALDDNLDIRSARARLRQARAQARKSGAGLLPELDLTGETSKNQSYRDHDLATETTEVNAGLAASYELDLWGRIRAGQEAARLSADAALKDVQAAIVSVAGEVTSAWVDLLAARQEIALLKQQIEVNTTQLELQLKRFENGMATALDVSQQQEVVAATRSELPQLKAEEKLFTHRLALLLGKADPGQLQLSRQSLPQPIPLPDTGLPADLVWSRPDVQAAYLRLLSADWDTSVARADRFPAVSLSASAALTSDSFSLSWADWISRLSSNLTGPLFDGGSRSAEVERTRAVADELLADYAATLLEALKDVHDAMVSESAQLETIQRRQEELRAAMQSRTQAKLRYINGQSSYLNFLDALQNVQRLERTILRARARLVKERIALYRSLGRGWTRKVSKAQGARYRQFSRQSRASLLSSTLNLEPVSPAKGLADRYQMDLLLLKFGKTTTLKP